MFANIYFLPAVGLLLSVATILFVRWLILYSMAQMAVSLEDQASAKKVINVVLVVLFAIMAFFVVTNTIRIISVNEVPRSVIDRSNIMKQQQQFEKAARKEAEQ